MISAQTLLAFVARENRFTPRIKCGAGFFRIMLQASQFCIFRPRIRLNSAALAAISRLRRDKNAGADILFAALGDLLRCFAVRISDRVGNEVGVEHITGKICTPEAAPDRRHPVPPTRAARDRHDRGAGACVVSIFTNLFFNPAAIIWAASFAGSLIGGLLMGILIVEDDDDQRNVMETLIKNDGHRDVLTAESGEIALSLLARGPGIQLDLILLDIYMPKIDGIESCVRIRGDARYRTVPIVMTTALADMKTVDRALKSGATDYLTKPLKVVDFLACVRAKLRLKAEFELHNLLQSEFASNFQQLGTLAGSQK